MSCLSFDTMLSLQWPEARALEELLHIEDLNPCCAFELVASAVAGGDRPSYHRAFLNCDPKCDPEV